VIPGGIEPGGIDDRTCIDLLDHEMGGRAEFGRTVVERKLRRCQSGIIRRAGMKIIGTIAEPREHRFGNDHRRGECDQPASLQQGGRQRGKLGGGGDGHNGKLRVVAAHRSRQNRLLS
jgi:hypothetical protein